MTPESLVLTRYGVRFAQRLFPCSIGKGGLSGNKREGDGATPIGLLRIVGMYYRPDRVVAPQPWAVPIGPRDLWSDASGQADYNQHVKAPYPYSCEQLRRADPLYDVVLVTDWNWPNATAGKGSAIFLHQWRRPGFRTEGCVAFSRADLHWIARRVSLGTKLIIGQR